MPEDGVAEKFNVVGVVPPAPKSHEREKYARESGPKIPLPLTPNPTTPPCACHRVTADCVKGPKYPVGLTLKYPCASRYVCKAVTSLPLIPTESDRPNTGQIGTVATTGLITTPVETLLEALAAAEKAINKAAPTAADELMSKNFLIIYRIQRSSAQNVTLKFTVYIIKNTRSPPPNQKRSIAGTFKAGNP